MSFESRYNSLNQKQQQAVDTIDGPLMVIAGPGTGKTELLSVRTANILKKTDSLAENILCLTFTDSGANAMRARLADIIGPDAYKVAIHTFHGFATEIINQNRQYFYNGAIFKPASDINRYEIIKSIFGELDFSSQIAGRMNGNFTHLGDALKVISELKSSGLTSDELASILDANDQVIAEVEDLLVPILSKGIKKTTADELMPALGIIRNIDVEISVPGVTSLAKVIANSLEAALNESEVDGSTKPITSWKNSWFKKDSRGNHILKSKEYQIKLREIGSIYDQFIARMQEAELFDFDDMILNVVHAMETSPELRFNLQEKYLYVMVDEFQDTNLAQMRILLNLIDNPVNEGRPNIMVVGDDDQAIYGFQGATVSNIHSFIEKFESAPRIVLTDNYRSTSAILEQSRQVITKGEDRLENLLSDVDKSLVAVSDKSSIDEVTVKNNQIVEFNSTADERNWLASDIFEKINSGEKPSSIAVLARRHQELIELLPYFERLGIKVNYEKNDDALELDSIVLIEQIAKLLTAILDGKLREADAMLPELLAHPAFGISPITIWQLSTKAIEKRKTWLEVMPEIPELAPIQNWLLMQSQASSHVPLERICDIIIGVPLETGDDTEFVSPFFDYFFSTNKLETEPDLYLTHLSGLIAIRTKLRDYYTTARPTLRNLLDFLDLQRESGGTINIIQPVSQSQDAIHLMTAHKAKGLEFETVYITGAIDSAWGERVRTGNRLIKYPENLPLMPPGDTLDDRLRLFYVAMTRAKRNLTITYGLTSDSGRDQLRASFLADTSLTEITPSQMPSLISALQTLETVWYQPLIRPTTENMVELLRPRLSNYKLNATHLGNFLDLSHGGPEAFLVNNLLRFPSAPHPATGYGRAMHTALQRAQSHVAATSEDKPLEDILKDFEVALIDQYLDQSDFDKYLKKGSSALERFISTNPNEFKPTQKTELNFAGQGVYIGNACLTGIIDVLDIDEGSATIIDYKTGKAVLNWKGSGDYEKIKIHRYRQQLMFYELLVRHSRDYSKYNVVSSIIQFIEPTADGDIIKLETSFTEEELTRFKKLIESVWHHITSLDLPDTDNFEPNYKGIIAFEDWLIDKTL